jgi:hypothetical protein
MCSLKKQIINISSFFFFVAVLLSCSQTKDVECAVPKAEIRLNEIGILKTRIAKEIKSSHLGIGCEVLDRDYASYDAYKEYLGNLGVKHARFQSGWAKTEKQHGIYDFEWLDTILDDCLSRGIQPWVCICYGNPIYPGAGDEQSTSPVPSEGEALQAWLKYVENLVERNKNKVFEWEIWNEQDHPGFKGATANVYAKFYIATAKVIRAVQPSARIITGGICYSGVTGYVRTMFDYIQQQGEIDKINELAFHGYVPNPDQTFKENLELAAFVKQYGKDIKVRQGENGAPSDNASAGALSNIDFTELSQAKWDLRRALGTIGNGISFSLFTISDFRYAPKFGGSEKRLNTKGLLSINDDLSISRAKQIYYGYQNLTSLFDSDIAPAGRKDDLIENTNKYSLYAFNDSQTQTPLLAWWGSFGRPEDSLTPEDITLKFNFYKFRNPVLIDIRSGVIYKAPSFSADGKIIVPAYDAPLILCEKEVLKQRKLF